MSIGSGLRHGLFLAVLLLCAACAAPNREAPAAGASDSGQEALQKQLRAAVEIYRPLLPLKVAEDGELFAMETYDLVLELSFRVSSNWSGGSSADDLATRMAGNTMDSLGCDNPKIVKLLKRDVIVRYRFVDKNGSLFFKHDLKLDSCNTLS